MNKPSTTRATKNDSKHTDQNLKQQFIPSTDKYTDNKTPFTFLINFTKPKPRNTSFLKIVSFVFLIIHLEAPHLKFVLTSP